VRAVLDASAAVHALVPSTLRSTVWARLRGSEVVAPALIDTEVLSALARLERGGEVTRSEADAAASSWQTFPCTRVTAEPLLEAIWNLRGALRIADAHYLALAGALGVPLLTADARLARAPVSGVSVLLVR